MILADNEHTCISGNASTLLAELAEIIRALKESFADHYDDEFVRRMIAKSGELAFMDDDEIENAWKKAMNK